MWKNMRGRLYIITALALVNIAIMKYHEFKNGNRAGDQVIAKEEKAATDSLLSVPR